MRKIEGYRCDQCEALYSKEAEALKCEADHQDRVKDIKITSVKFRDFTGTYGMDRRVAQLAPKRINVKFSEASGDFATYTLENYGYRGV